MNPLLAGHELPGLRLTVVLVDCALKSFLLLAIAGVCCVCARRASAAVRHLIWSGALVGALSFPVISLIAPAWEKPLWTVSPKVDAGNQVSIVVSLAPENSAVPHVTTWVGEPRRASDRQGRETGFSAMRTDLKLPWVGAGLAIWCAGLVLCCSILGMHRCRLWALQRKAHPNLDQEWRSLLEGLSQELGLRCPVRLLRSVDQVMPVTWGVLRPAILLPAESSQWPAERRRIVLLHELGHVKRWDCLSQLLGQIVCTVYWFNPLVWLAARHMCIERECACDDLVLGTGCKPSEYATHLVDIARSFSSMSRTAGLAMARSSNLENRISAIVATAHSRRLRPLVRISVWLTLGSAIIAIAANHPASIAGQEAASQPEYQHQLARLKSFSAAKLGQAQDLAARAGLQITPEFQRFFTAAVAGDSQTVTNMYEDFKRRHPQYSRETNQADVHLSTPYWSHVLEICLAYDHVLQCTPKYTALLADGIIDSIPAGSIYFGGTDPGRGIPTAFEKSQITGDPFFILTQNALADGTYLKYLHDMYGRQIYAPSDADSQRCFAEYSADALGRLEHDQQFPAEPKQLRKGENVRLENGHAAVSGQVAVMSINGLLTKLIFDQNPGREFFIEESFPLDWMYPHLEPHGLIMKINRDELAELPAETIDQDRAHWQRLVEGMVGGWLTENTSISAIASWVESVYAQKELSNFTGDLSFIQNDYAKRLFSKLRSSLAGVYAWRETHTAVPGEAQRMAANADNAFRQAYVLCPYSPEALFRYTTFLAQHHRADNALLLATTSLKLEPANRDIQNLVQTLRAQTAENR